jgi:FMN-dependent NADH-azoreductase
MANENVANMKSLNTRIKLKYDSYSNWTSKNPTLLEGEVAIATIPAGTNVPTSDSTTMQHLPNVVIKVGDGKTEYNLLPFLSALAADVYAWAKAPEKPVYKATEIEGLDNFIAGEIQDTDTQYTIQSVEGETYKFQLMKKNKGDADAAFTHVCYIDLTEVDSRLDALEQKMGSKSVADQINDVVAGLDMTKLESAEGSGKVLSYIQQVDGQVEAEMRSLVEADIPALSIAKTTGLQDALNAKQNNLTFTDDYAADTSVVATKKYVDDTAAAAINLNNNDAAVEHQFVTEAKQENGEVKVTRRALVKEDIPAIDMTQVTDLDKEFAKKQDNLEFMTAYDAASNKVATQAEIKAVNDAIGGMDLAKKEATAGKIISFIEQADGVVTADVRDLTAADFKDDLIPEAAVNGLTERIDAKQDILVWADGYAYNAETNKAATVDYVANAVAGLNGAMHFIGKVEGDTFEAAVAGLTPNGGDVVLYGYDEYVYDAANKVWMPLGNESIYQTKEQAAADHKAIDDAIALKQDILGFEGTYNKETNKVVTKSAMDEAIANAIDIDVASKEEAGKVVLGVAQQDGRIEVTHGALTSAHFADDVVPEAAVAGLTEALASKQNNLSFMTEPSAENKVATKTEIDALSKTISDMDLAQVDATQGHILTGLKQEDGVVTATTRALVKEDIPVIEQAQVNGLDKTLADADAAAQGYANTAEANAKNFATEEIGKAIAAIDINVAAEEGKFVTGFTVEDGALKASTTSTVDAKYLTQTTGDYLVFDCGTASTVY